MRLQQAGISVKTGFTRNGKSKGISYEKDGQAFSGTQLGAAYTFPGLQKHRGVDYQPERDDERISQLLLNPAKPLPVEQLQYQFLELEQKQKKAGGAGGEVQQGEKELTLNYSVSSPASPAPIFAPPPEDEVLWTVLYKYLNEKRFIPDFLLQRLHQHQLAYVSDQRNILFIKRDLDGEKTGALVWSKPEQDHRTVEYNQNAPISPGWFYIQLAKNPQQETKNVFLCSSPIDAMSAAVYAMLGTKGLPANKTMFMVVDDPTNLPLEFLRNTNQVILAFNNDDLGNQTASAVLELLPESKRLKTVNPDWSQELKAHLRHEQEKQKTRERGFSL